MDCRSGSSTHQSTADGDEWTCTTVSASLDGLDLAGFASASGRSLWDSARFARVSHRAFEVPDNSCAGQPGPADPLLPIHSRPSPQPAEVSGLRSRQELHTHGRVPPEHKTGQGIAAPLVDPYQQRIFNAVCGAIGHLEDHRIHLGTCFAATHVAGHHNEKQSLADRYHSMLQDTCGMCDKVAVGYLVGRLITAASTGEGAAYASTPNLRDVFDEVVLDRIAHELYACGTNFRVIFKAYDTHSFGSLNRKQLTLLLVHFCRTFVPTPHVLNFVCDSVAAGSAQGCVDYDTFFNAVFRKRELMNLPNKGRGGTERTIRAVAVVARHGARLPLKSFPRTLRWPASAAFWQAYGGKLTPVGMEQQRRLGAKLRDKYVTTERLFDEDNPKTPSRIMAYTSNMDRTLMSAQSCLLGLCPGASVAFIVDEDDVVAEQQKELSRDSIRICMSMSDYTPLLHGFKNNPAYSQLKQAAIEAGRFHEWARSAAHVKVLEKVWNMTGFENISPKRPMYERLSKMQSVAQQIGIEQAHQMELLMNPSGLQLDTHDREVVLEIANYACRLRYCGHSSDDQAELSKLASGLLPAAIVNNFRAIAKEGDSEGHFTLYSAHDNTIMALLAHLGFREFPLPQFAAHLVFELHEVDSAYVVKVLYNSDPRKYGFDSDAECEGGNLEVCQYVALPREGVLDWDCRCERSNAGMSLDDFALLLMKTRGSFSTPEEWNAAAHSQDGISDACAAPAQNTPSRSSISLMGNHFREHITRATTISESSEEESLLLKPFLHQVAGHPMTFMELGNDLLCKPIRATCATESTFYKHVFNAEVDADYHALGQLVPYLPRYHGEIFVDAKLQTVAYVQPDGSHTRVRTRTYSRSVPSRYSLIELDTSALETASDTDVECAGKPVLQQNSAAHSDCGDSPDESGNDMSGQVCIVLENLVAPFTKPCVLDIKLGTRQYGDDSSAEKRAKAIKRCASTTSAELGLRVSGMQVWRASDSQPVLWGKDYGKSLTTATFDDVFHNFFDCDKGASRIAVMKAILTRVKSLHSTLKSIDTFRFFSSSLLLIYDGIPNENRIDVRLVDFARVRLPVADGSADYPSGPDEGALLGLSNLAERLANACGMDQQTP